ncbi:hypothetical protein ACIBJI_22900 [Nocardia sp. NPDC050408]|uniref:hypothetical protein n=1 Tax=unclassified Nocardia TaxID=2637762 RepID=UPI003438726D
MNRIAISITMLIPPLFLLSLVLAQPVSTAPPNSSTAAALPWGPLATTGHDGGFPGTEVVFGDCTGSACSAGGGLTWMPDPLRVAPLVVNVAPDALRVDIAPDAHRADLALNVPNVDSALEVRPTEGVQTPISAEGATPLATDIARRGGTGSASSLPRVFSDLLSRLLDLVQRAPLPLRR